MPQTLPEGAFVLPADMERIEAAQRDLLNTNDANGSVLVRVNLHVHYEYPKHITIGKETVAVNSAEEEARLTAPAASDAPNTQETSAPSETA